MASTKSSNIKNTRTKTKTEDEQEVNREDLGVKYAASARRTHRRRKKKQRTKRRGNPHSQLIGEQRKGAHELTEDTAQKIKTIN